MVGSDNMVEKIKEAVILAGGLGKRLRGITGSIPKYFYKVEKYPMIAYPITSLTKVGVEKIIIVVNEKFLRKAKRILSKYENIIKSVEIVYVNNPKPEWGNGYSLILGSKNVLNDKFFVSMADHIYSFKILLKILKELNNACIVVGGDSKPKYVNVDEATKILAENSVLKDIGKELKKFTHIDIGVMVFSKKAISIVSRSGFPLESLTVSKAILIASSECFVKVADIKGDYWVDIDTPKDLVEILYGKARPVLDKVLEEMMGHELLRQKRGWTRI